MRVTGLTGLTGRGVRSLLLLPLSPVSLPQWLGGREFEDIQLSLPDCELSLII